MKEMFIEFTKNGSVYGLSTFKDLLKITRDGKVIHVQLANIYQQPLLDIGLKDSNYIKGNLSEYIEFCEINQVYKGIEFDADEWERHTKIYATMRYASPKDGKISLYKKQIDSVQGNMRGFTGDRLIEESYYTFVGNRLRESDVKTISNGDDLLKHLNRDAGRTIYNLG